MGKTSPSSLCIRSSSVRWQDDGKRPEAIAYFSTLQITDNLATTPAITLSTLICRARVASQKPTFTAETTLPLFMNERNSPKCDYSSLTRLKIKHVWPGVQTKMSQIHTGWTFGSAIEQVVTRIDISILGVFVALIRQLRLEVEQTWCSLAWLVSSVHGRELSTPVQLLFI